MAGEKDDLAADGQIEAGSGDGADDTTAAIQKLQKQVAEERAARIAAEQRAFEASKRETVAKIEVDDTNLKLLENAIDVVKGNNQQLLAAKEQALANRDNAAIAQIDMAMMENIDQLKVLNEGKARLEAQPKRQVEIPKDPVEALAVQLTPRSADWVRRHPEFARNPKLYAKMIAAHNLAAADDIKSDSDEYFDAIEKTLGLTPSRAEADDGGDEGEAVTSAAKATGGRMAPPAAPVSRSSSGNGSSAPRGYRKGVLTPEQAEAAAFNKMSEEEYYKSLQSLKRENKIN
jgi:hypothetical protein